ncbi:MAG TPA: SGNH/GDSL hydrolase family protein [Cytophagaceae bacterium]|jgi:hypothetical protein
MLNNYKIYCLALSFLLLNSCAKKNDPGPDKLDPVPQGASIFTRYVAVGNSLTSGYTNDALYRQGQENSYPNILAQQMKAVGGGNFVQPIVPDDEGISLSRTSTPTAKIVAVNGRDCAGAATIVLERADKIPDPKTLLPIRDQGPFNNLGVPGAKVKDLLDPSFGESKVNPFYFRFATDAGKTTVISQAQALNASFFTLWIGNNDILGYASEGGEGGAEMITPAAEFEANLKIVLDSLTKNGAKGAIANVPDITNIPRFTRIPIRKNGNYYLIEDGNGGPSRPIKEGEYIHMGIPEDSLKCGTWGTTTPIPRQYVLDDKEVSSLRSTILAYKSIIEKLASQYNIALVDINSKMEILKTGLTYSGATYSTAYQTGGIFSWDGVHLTARGNAIVANFFIEAINGKYATLIPLADVSKYPTLDAPVNR